MKQVFGKMFAGIWWALKGLGRLVVRYPLHILVAGLLLTVGSVFINDWVFLRVVAKAEYKPEISATKQFIPGEASAKSMIHSLEWIHHGNYLGYRPNDLFIPCALTSDNMCSYQEGAVVGARTILLKLKYDGMKTRASQEDPNISMAAEKIHFDMDSWVMPSTESEYKEAFSALKRYLDGLPSGKSIPLQRRAHGAIQIFLVMSKELGGWQGVLNEEHESLTFFNADDNVYKAAGMSMIYYNTVLGMLEDFGEILSSKPAVVEALKSVLAGLKRASFLDQDNLMKPFIVMNSSGRWGFANIPHQMSAVLGVVKSHLDVVVTELQQ